MSVDMYGFTRRFAFPSACLCWHKVMPSSTVTWVLDRSVAAYPCGSGCCVPTASVLEGLVQPLLHALVSDHLVQLCVATILNVLVGILNGPENAQESTPVSPFDAMHHDVVSVPYRVLHCRPDICPLLVALLAVGRRKGHQLSRRVTPPGSQDHAGNSRFATPSWGTCPRSVALGALPSRCSHLFWMSKCR